MKTNIYIDFDSTLFNTDEFYGEFLNICRKYNVDNKRVINIKNEIFKKACDFNLDILAEKIFEIHNLKKEFLDEVEKLYSSKYLFDDTISFLESIYLKYELVLFTYGNKSYQTKKINATGIDKYFKDIIITENRKDSLNIDYVNSVFIDNNPNEIIGYYNKGARKLIRLRHESDFRCKVDTNLEDILEFSNLSDIINSNAIDWVVNYE
ncbi:MAG: HAD hydrolase-like protein [Bacilli bacterium]|nr:HAD hydrolase-like protein [Bacilli bacterium]